MTYEIVKLNKYQQSYKQEKILYVVTCGGSCIYVYI